MNFSLYSKRALLLFCIALFYTTSFSQNFSDNYVSIYLEHNNLKQKDDTLSLQFIIEKKQVYGFAKFELKSASVSFEKLEIPGTAISYFDNSLKIIWVDLPPGKYFKVQIPVKAKVDLQDYSINGSFSYILDKEVHKIPFDEINISKTSTINNPISVNNTPLPLKENADEAKIVQTKDNYYVSDIQGKTGKYPKRSKNVKSINTNYDSIYKNNIVYKVQIAALKKRMPEKKLHQIYSGTYEIEEEFHNDGWVKYTIGHFDTYEEAQKLKIKCGVKDAFITAKSGGKGVHILDAINESINKTESIDKYYYSIQIAALSKFYSNSKIRKLYNIDHIISMEEIEKLFKYTVGNFTSYNDAESFKQKLAISDAFIIAYKNGKRIDIQSARKITD